MKNEFKLAGYTFTLKNIRYGIHSEETPDFMANLYCNGKLIAFVENDGHGGSTNARWNPDHIDFAREVEMAVRKEVWLTCQDGHQIYYTLGEVADEVLDITERNKEINRLQKNALVLEKKDNIYFSTIKFKLPIKDIIEYYPEEFKKHIQRVKEDGWTIVNTNIPEEFLK